MKVLLTGASGFIGKNLKPALSKSHEVFAPGSDHTDLRSQSQVSRLLSVHSFKPDAIIHAAGTVGGIGANKENPGKFLYENLIMGANLIHEALLNDVPKFVLFGTVCSYPKHTPAPFKESSLWDGYPEETNAPYGIAKKALMEMLSAYHQQYEFNSTTLLPTNMYGPEDHFNLTSSHVIPAIIVKVRNAMSAKEKSITLWGTGQASREFLFVEDCVEAVELALEKDTPPEPINIGNGKEVKISELAELICELMGFDGEILYDTTKPDGQPRRCLDVSRAKDVLGFEAKTSLREGLQKTLEAR